MQYRLPPRFIEDVIDRELLPPDVIVRQTQSYVIAELDEAQLAELRKDAEFYVSQSAYWDESVRGLVASARATLRAIAKAEAEEKA